MWDPTAGGGGEIDTVGYDIMNVIGSRTSFVTASVRSSMH